jgi:tryptophan synthase beta chain
LTHSVSAGLDYAAVGPEHSLLRDLGRARYSHVTDREAVRGFDLLNRWEGILPALESAHAVAYMIKHARKFNAGDLVIINLSGRGDKDVQQVAAWKRGQGVAAGRGG